MYGPRGGRIAVGVPITRGILRGICVPLRPSRRLSRHYTGHAQTQRSAVIWTKAVFLLSGHEEWCFLHSPYQPSTGDPYSSSFRASLVSLYGDTCPRSKNFISLLSIKRTIPWCEHSRPTPAIHLRFGIPPGGSANFTAPPPDTELCSVRFKFMHSCLVTRDLDRVQLSSVLPLV